MFNIRYFIEFLCFFGIIEWENELRIQYGLEISTENSKIFHPFLSDKIRIVFFLVLYKNLIYSKFINKNI